MKDIFSVVRAVAEMVRSHSFSRDAESRIRMNEPFSGGKRKKG